MPRVTPLIQEDRLKQTLTEFIVGRMKILHIKQKDLADEFDVNRPAISKRISNCTWTYYDLVKLFRILNATNEDIINLMKD